MGTDLADSCYCSLQAILNGCQYDLLVVHILHISKLALRPARRASIGVREGSGTERAKTIPADGEPAARQHSFVLSQCGFYHAIER